MTHIYPGMGASSEMYGPLWRTQVPGHYHDWPVWNGESSIHDWALRLIDEHSIQDGDTLIGSSLGGIIACEIAKIRSIQRTILIGSACQPEEIHGLLSILHPLVDLTPITFVKACAGKIPADLCQMFAVSDPAFIRAMCKAIFQWQGALPSQSIFRIHGRHDRVIPLPAGIDCVIPGGHLIAMSHPEACIDALGNL